MNIFVEDVFVEVVAHIGCVRVYYRQVPVEDANIVEDVFVEVVTVHYTK